MHVTTFSVLDFIGVQVGTREERTRSSIVLVFSRSARKKFFLVVQEVPGETTLLQKDGNQVLLRKR